MADELEHAHQRIADDRRAQVPDVHLLGDVGRRVVDDDALRVGGQSHADALVAFQHGKLLLQERLVERDVDEARAGDLERGLPGEICGRNDVVGNIARLATELLGQSKGTVGLRVGTITRPYDRIDRAVVARDRGKRWRQQISDDDEGISHEHPIVPVHPFDRRA